MTLLLLLLLLLLPPPPLSGDWNIVTRLTAHSNGEES